MKGRVVRLARIDPWSAGAPKAVRLMAAQLLALQCRRICVEYRKGRIGADELAVRICALVEATWRKGARKARKGGTPNDRIGTTGDIA